MSFINFPSPTPIFPALYSQAWSVHIRPTWATASCVFVNGSERRAARAAFPLWEFELTYEGMRDQTLNATPYEQYAGELDFQQIAGLFMMCEGDYGEFYYEHPDDNSRAAGFIGNADGVLADFVILKWYNNFAGGYQGVDPIGGINQLTSVYFNGTPVTSGYSVSGQILHFAIPPGAGIAVSADFSFYYRCRFTDNKQQYSQFLKDLWEYKVCRFRSVKP
jgi:hypothetical protein